MTTPTAHPASPIITFKSLSKATTRIAKTILFALIILTYTNPVLKLYTPSCTVNYPYRSRTEETRKLFNDTPSPQASILLFYMENTLSTVDINLTRRIIQAEIFSCISTENII